jgi:hypothetical protein
MPELNFSVEGAEPVPYAAAPLLALKLRVRQETGTRPPVPIQSVLLRCQVRIDPVRRRYQGEEPERLRELFGAPADWGRSMHGMLWTHAAVVVPPFTDSVLVDLPVPCTSDFNVAAAKYFDALEDGEAPLSLLFSGNVFYQDDERGLQVAPVSWKKDAAFRLPVRVWKEMMEHYYPNAVPLSLRKDVFDRLSRYKREHGLQTWEQALESLLPPRREEGAS